VNDRSDREPKRQVLPGKGLRAIRYAISIEGAFFAAAKAETIGELQKLPTKRAANKAKI
jgi:hypothetical protein